MTKPQSPLLRQFLESFNAAESSDLKLHLALEGMAQAINQEKGVDFHLFWEIRSLCTPLFKLPINPSLRTQSWDHYHALSEEARRLKAVSEKGSALTVEQFEAALAPLEEEIPSLPSAPSAQLEIGGQFLAKLQGELDQLNPYADRLRSLRSELTGLSMRIREKSRLFQRLSELGKQLHPRRKELIDRVSRLYEEECDHFVQRHFGEKGRRIPPHALREEIKRLQATAKRLTLSAKSFAESRLRLSECWDQVREEGRRRKQERSEKEEPELEALLAELTAFGDRIDDPTFKPEKVEIAPEMSLEELERVLEARRQKRRESKELLDQLRRSGGGFGFDFERAMAQQELIEKSRHQLEEADQRIAELEEEIAKRSLG